jgi:hypothetical protein
VGSRPLPCEPEPIAVPPLPAGTAPDGSAVGAATANRRRVIHRTNGAQCPGPAPAWLVRPPLDRMPRLQAPRCHPGAATGIPVRSPRLRPIASPLHQTRDHSGPRRLTTDKSQRAQAELAPVLCSLGPPPPPGFATCGTASGRRSRPRPGTARPSSHPVVHRGFVGHPPPIGFCNLMSPEHAHAPSDLRLGHSKLRPFGWLRHE